MFAVLVQRMLKGEKGNVQGSVKFLTLLSDLRFETFLLCLLCNNELRWAKFQCEKVSVYDFKLVDLELVFSGDTRQELGVGDIIEKIIDSR